VRWSRLYSTWTAAIDAQPRRSAGGGGGRDAPRRHIGEAAVDDLARADEIVEPARDFLDRCHAVVKMDEVEVDAVGLEAPKACLDRLDHRLAVGATRGDRRMWPGGAAVFRGDDEVVAVGGDERADRDLGLTLLIGVRRVDEVPARVGVSAQDGGYILRSCAITAYVAQQSRPKD